MHEARLVPDELHDVDLATSGPAHLVDVRSEHPQGRPDALADREDGADVDPTILEVVNALGLETGGGVSAVVPGKDVATSILHLDVLRAVGVVLEFVVAPPPISIAEVVGPLGRIRCTWGVEFITPHQRHAGVGVRRAVACVADLDARVVVADGADGLLDVVPEIAAFRRAQGHDEVLVRFQPLVDDDLHLDGLLRLARSERERAQGGDVVLARGRRSVHGGVLDAYLLGLGLVNPHVEGEDGVGLVLEGGPVIGEPELGGRRLLAPSTGREEEDGGYGKDQRAQGHCAAKYRVK